MEKNVSGVPLLLLYFYSHTFNYKTFIIFKQKEIFKYQNIFSFKMISLQKHSFIHCPTNKRKFKFMQYTVLKIGYFKNYFIYINVYYFIKFTNSLSV